jgi:hypothetical protein
MLAHEPNYVTFCFFFSTYISGAHQELVPTILVIVCKFVDVSKRLKEVTVSIGWHIPETKIRELQIEIFCNKNVQRLHVAIFQSTDINLFKNRW